MVPSKRLEIFIAFLIGAILVGSVLIVIGIIRVSKEPPSKEEALCIKGYRHCRYPVDKIIIDIRRERIKKFAKKHNINEDYVKEMDEYHVDGRCWGYYKLCRRILFYAN